VVGLRSQVIQEYAANILKSGLLDAVGSAPVAVPTVMDKSVWVLQLLASASRIEATYLAWEMQPSNEQVIATLDAGVENILIVDPRAPQDILVYLRDLLNAYVTYGSTTSFLEVYRMIPKIVEAWSHRGRKARGGVELAAVATQVEEHADADDDADDDDDDEADGLKQSDSDWGGYETEMWKFIEENFNGAHGQDDASSSSAASSGQQQTNKLKFFNSMVEFKSARSCFKKLSSANVWDAYASWIGNWCRFTDKGLDKGVVFFINNAVVKKLLNQGAAYALRPTSLMCFIMFVGFWFLFVFVVVRLLSILQTLGRKSELRIPS
jgi:hypothetical protein